MFKRFFGGLVLGLASITTQAAVFDLPDAEAQVVGQNLIVYANAEDTLLDIARAFDLGYGDIVNANPDVDPWVPGQDQAVVVPMRFILPDAPRDGIVINIPEMRLYYYSPQRAGQSRQVVTHPIGIGREGRDTPLGTMSVIQKRKDPSWTPPESVRKEHAAEGDILPAVVPPGPDNPLGAYAMRLSNPSYLIHGTHRPFGVGLRVSSGCIRLYPEDIENLFHQISLKTPVHIVYDPYKAGIKDNMLFLEAHKPLDDLDTRHIGNMTPMTEAILDVQNRLPAETEWSTIESVVRTQNGVVEPLHADVKKNGEPEWFVHAGINQERMLKMNQAIKQLNLAEWFWPIRGGASGEIVLGPFDNKQQADEMSEKLAEQIGKRVWTANLPNMY